MKKVTYKKRLYIDRFTCIDRIEERSYISFWQSGGLTYFKENQFNIFSIDTNDIINL